MEHFSCVNWTDETLFTIFFGVGEQNTIDFSSAGGLRTIYASLKRAVLGWLQCKYEILVCVCVRERENKTETDRQTERQRDRLLAGSLAVAFGSFLADISAVKQTRSNLSTSTEQHVSLDFSLTFQIPLFLTMMSFIN